MKSFCFTKFVLKYENINLKNNTWFKASYVKSHFVQSTYYYIILITFSPFFYTEENEIIHN